MNVFVLNTGRCGSLAFAKACEHATNFTAGHESRAGEVGSSRLDYPNNHIEVDNRLAWFLGPLTTRWGDRARYVHLLRNRDDCAASFVRRWPKGIIGAFGQRILMGCTDSQQKIAKHYVGTVNANIREFTDRRQRVMRIAIEDIEREFPLFWRWIGASGDMDSALAEFDKGHHVSNR